MDFFDHQDRARRNTGRLVLLLALAVLGTIALTYVIVVACTVGFQQYAQAQTHGVLFDEQVRGSPTLRTLLRLDLLMYVGLGVLAVVGGGSLFKVAQLAGGGGQAIALHLGGRLIGPDTRDPTERRVLNVVEEMAIASGTPVPPVFIMDSEPGINAFAAGYSPANAVIGVTRGCAERLSRDQLQGVMAHEFSHILNGDMRLNIRLIGMLHGILLIGMIGYFIFRSALYSGRYGGSRRGGNPLPLIALGGGLMAVGFIGTFFGQIIKAAVSRQREFLADASAVQFTRNPEGIAGALKVIGGYTEGSRLRSPNAPEASHMFFSQGIASLFSTHPPLDERIRRIDPTFSGAPVPQRAATVSERTAPISPLAQNLVSQAGQPTAAHIAEAHNIMEHLPAVLRDAAHEPYGARALIYAILLDRDTTIRRRQMERLDSAADSGVVREMQRIAPHVERLEPRFRLPIVDLAIGTLRGLSPRQYETFAVNVKAVVESDAKISVFEWVLQRIVLDHLDAHFKGRPPAKTKHQTLAPVQQQCAVLLSVLAYAGHRTPDAADRAFAAARQHIDTVSLLPPDRCGLQMLDDALRDLAGLTPQLKRRVLTAAAASITADRQVTAAEAELFRAFADTLGVPVPPLLAGQTA
jgi:Zn-dependent protease with chaperone function